MYGYFSLQISFVYLVSVYNNHNCNQFIYTEGLMVGTTLTYDSDECSQLTEKQESVVSPAANP